MYCVTSYRLGYKTDVQSLRKFYMENGSDKVLGKGRDGMGRDGMGRDGTGPLQRCVRI